MSKEIYLSLTAPNAQAPAEALNRLMADLPASLAEHGLNLGDVALVRFFSSDITRHAPLIKATWPGNFACQTVLIGQTPLDSSYLSLQVWALRGDIEKTLLEDGSLLMRHGAYQSLWSVEMPGRLGNSEEQTDEILARLGSHLWRHGMTLEPNVLRTWYYMRDIDNNYTGMIKSRLRHYEVNGLTPRSHFIASTGIEGHGAWPGALSWLHFHAIQSMRKEQLAYLKALDNMSPTAIYGVNFERGTLATYGDRIHAHISGTASIDKRGKIMFMGDVKAQTMRALENVEALLHEGNLSFADMKAATIYCRDGHDYAHVAQLVRDALPSGCALNFTNAPVCRPEWLVEIEGEAVRETAGSPFGNYL